MNPVLHEVPTPGGFMGRSSAACTSRLAEARVQLSHVIAWKERDLLFFMKVGIEKGI
jgi:hypothetical protein